MESDARADAAAGEHNDSTSRFEQRLERVRASGSGAPCVRELVKLWCTGEGMVLDGTDDGSVVARAMARVRAVLPAEALVAGGEVISPVRTRGKTRRNLGC